MTLHAVNHSIGLVLTHEDPSGLGEFSFRVDAEGVLEELAGWGYAGPLPDTGHFVNAPPNPMALHTVLVEGDEPEVLVTLREIIEAHNEVYAGCQVWVSSGAPHTLQNWARAGCPEPNLVAVPTDEELAEANTTAVPVADDSFFTESEPISEPVSYEEVEAEARAGIDERVAKARSDHERKELRAELEALGVIPDKRLGVEKLRKLLEETKAAKGAVDESPAGDGDDDAEADAG